MPKVLLCDFSGVLLQGLHPDGSVILNQELMTFLRPLKDRYQLGVYTNSYQLLQIPSAQSALSSLFHKIFFAKQLNWPKSEPESYLGIAKELKVAPEEMVFIDDSPYNILAAQQASLTAFLYTSNRELFDQLQPLLGL